MPDIEVEDPLFGRPNGKRMELAQAPLTAVIAQVRFPEIFSIQKKEFVAQFQERIRGAYPFANTQAAVSVQVGEGNAPSLKQTTTWRFSDAKHEWAISLGPSFLAFQTSKYTNRIDFTNRLREVFIAMAETINPAVVTRTGIRYVNQIRSPEMAFLRELFRPEIGSFSSSGLKEHIEHSLTEALCNTAEGKLLLRWGLMPPGASHDLGLLAPIEERSWIFDLDGFSDHPVPLPFDPETTTKLVYELATRINMVFYWAARQKLVDTFGGKET
mgnify:CR=1 FL=1